MITSKNNPLIVQLAKLQESKKERERQQSVLVFGEKLVRELIPFVPIKRMIAVENIPLLKNIPTDQQLLVTPQIFQKLAGHKTDEKIAAEFHLPSCAPFEATTPICAFDRITDPGNLGTLVRSGCAFGISHLFFLPGCVDLFNEKVIRASAGCNFRIKWQEGDYNELEKLAKNFGLEKYTADLEGTKLDQLDKSRPFILLISNEATGASEWAKNWGTQITIPMEHAVESLNAAVAGSIIMYELTK